MTPHDFRYEVTIPSDPEVEFLISRTARYVSKDGAALEGRIKERENSNPAFRFLFEYDSPESIYYRWVISSPQRPEPGPRASSSDPFPTSPHTPQVEDLQLPDG